MNTAIRSCIKAVFGLLIVLLAAPMRAETLPEVTLGGGPDDLRENIRLYLPFADTPCSTPLWRLKTQLIDAQKDIEQAAQALGFYHLTFTSEFTQVHNCWRLHLHFEPGEPVKVKEFSLSVEGAGSDDDIFKPVISTPGIAVGARLHHGHYDALKNRLITQASSHGYFDAHFEITNLQINTIDNTASIQLVYNTGARYRIGQIRLQHNILDESFLFQYMNFQSGDFYDTDKLLELKNFYNASNYFMSATASPDVQNLHDQQVDINVQLEARKRFAYSVGAGVSSDTGARILLGVEDRFVNDRGHKIKADISKSVDQTKSQFTYTIPMGRPAYESVNLYTRYDREQTDTSLSILNTYGTSYTYYQQSKWLHTYAIEVANEDSVVADVEVNSHLLIPSVTFARTKTDGSPYVLGGWSLWAKLSGSPKTLGSDLSFEQFSFRAKYVEGLTYGRLLLRTEVGVTDVNDFGRLPASLRFFAGGATSVRGYDYESLGPKENDKVVGGNNLWVNTLEYDYKFLPSWAVAVFVDAGNAADDFNLELKRGAGMGLRWISPVGPVRLDVARGLDDPKGWNLHISMGPDL